MISRLIANGVRISFSLLITISVSSCRSVSPSHLVSQAENDGERGTAVRSGLSLRIWVEVAGRREIDESALRITEEGDIRLPLLGRVNVGGRSLPELEAFLAERYAEFFVCPRVTVDFADATREGLAPWGSITVLGRVQQPGRVSLPPTRDLTVSAAIQAAGGLNSSARIRAIRVTRFKEDGTEQSFRVNLHAIGRLGRTNQDRVLQDGDVIYVPEAMF